MDVRNQSRPPMCTRAFRCRGIGKARRFRWRVGSISRFGQHFLKIDDLLDLCQKPAVDLGEVKYFVESETGPQGVADKKYPFGVGNAQFARDHVARQDVAITIN